MKLHDLGMKLIRSVRLLAGGILVSILVLGLACGGEDATPTSTARATPTSLPVPTATSIPTPTPAPTLAPTLASTATAVAAPTPTPTAAPTPTSIPTPTSFPTPSAYPIMITDSNGKEFVFNQAPERIVAYDSAAVEILFAIGQGHRVAGVHDFVDYPPETASIPRVGDAFSVNTEAIIELEPDLIFTFFASPVDALEATGAPVLLIDSLNSDLDDVIEHFRLWGRVTDSVDEAEVQVADIRARLDALAERLEAVEQGPTLYNHTFEFWTPGGDTLHGAIYQLLKVEMITQEQSGWAQLSPEQIVIKDPEVIVSSASDVEQLTGNSAFDDVKAVKEGRIIMPEQSFAVAGTRLIAAIEEMAALLYPELFQ